MSLTQVVKSYLVPGSAEFLVLGVVFGLVLLYVPRVRAWGRRWLMALSVGYLLLSTPLAAGWLHEAFRRSTSRIETTADARGARTLVVLGNGAVSVGRASALHLPSTFTAHNILEAARLYRLLGRPRIVASGGMPPGAGNDRPEADVIREYLLRLGVADADMILERDSITTYTQAVNVARMLDRRAPIVLVTMPSHMPRARALFEAQRFTVIPSPSSFHLLRRDAPAARILPSRYALRASEIALYEGLAWVNSWTSGQLRPH